MAVVKVERQARSRLARIEWTGKKLNGVPVVKPAGQYVYDVYSDDPNDNEWVMFQDFRLPQMGERFVIDGIPLGGVWVKDMTPTFIERSGNLYLWEFSYELSGDFNGGQTSTGDDAEDETVVEDGFSFSATFEDVASKYDLDNKFNVNTLGEWFADPINLKRGVLEFTYTRTERRNPVLLSRQYSNCVNATEWHGFAPGTIYCDWITGSRQTTAEGDKFQNQYVLRWKEAGWTTTRANAGNYAMINGVVQRVLNVDGSPRQEPVLLDATGAVLAANEEPYILTFRTTGAAELNDLGLPDPRA